MPWFRQPQRLLSRLLGLGTTVWLCRKVGCWARSFGRLGVLVLRFVHRGRPSQRMPDYGHLLLDALYPGRRPSTEAAVQARALAEESRSRDAPEEALRLLGEAVLLSPPDASLYLARAEAHARWRQLVEALDDAELCVSLDASCAAGWLAKGQAEHALGRAADAALSFQAGLRADPQHPELLEQLAAVRAEPPPNLLRQLRDLVFAARLGLENLFRMVEDPEKTTDAFVEANSELLDAQIGLLAQTLRVNTAVLFDSPMLCDAYEQIVYACAQLMAGAPAAFSTRLRNAPNIVEGLSLALRVGWHVHHTTPKLAANALVALATCPNADDGLRRQAVRHVLAGMLRWLLDARPEPDRDGEEVCGCSCSVPWKAAACFLERFFEPGRPQPWVKEECEAWADVAQLCQWLTLSVRDYHATPLGLVGLLQLPGVAAAVMRSGAVVDFFVPAPLLEDGHDFEGGADGFGPGEGAAAGGGPATAHGAAAAAGLPPTDLQGLQRIDEPLPPSQRLGEWLMASVGYLFLFIEGDVLFTVCACRALQTMVAADAEGDGTGRLVRSLWLGVPLLNKLSLLACSHTAALDLLHCIFQSPHHSIRVAARSLAHALARPLPAEVVPSIAYPSSGADEAAADEASSQSGANSGAGGTARGSGSAEVAAAGLVAATASALPGEVLMDDIHLEEDVVPTWAEFYQELLNELAVPSDGKDEAPELVTLLNFDEKAPLLAERASVCIVPEGTAGEDAKERSGRALLEFTAVPAAWNRFAEAVDGVEFNGAKQHVLFHASEDEMDVGTEEYINDSRKKRCVVLMSRRSIRQSSKVQNWAQAVTAAEKAGAVAVVVFNNLDAMEPFRMGLFGEQAPSIPAFMVSAADGAALGFAAATGCDVFIQRSALDLQERQADSQPPPWPLTGGHLPADVAQAWSLLEAMSAHEPDVQAELQTLLARMSVPEKRVWLTRRLVRHHRSQQAPDGGLLEPPLAFVEGDRSLSPAGHIASVRQQMCEETGLGADDLCGEFEVRFKNEQGVGSAVMREWMDLVAREAFLHPGQRLLRSFDHRQTFWPDAAAPFCNPQWKLDYEALGRLLGLALWQSCTLDLPLHPHVCGLLFGFDRQTAGTTLADVDEELERTKVQWLLAHPVVDLGFDLPFSDSLGSDDARESVPEVPQDEDNPSEGSVEPNTPAASTPPCALPSLVRQSDRLPGGERSWPGKALLQVGAAEVALDRDCLEQVVSDANKADFTKALTEWRLFGSIEPQIGAMRVGLRKVVPESVLQELRSLLQPAEIAQLLSGLGEVSIDDWERHTAYAQGLTRESDVVTWFWRTVRAWAASPEDCVRLPQLLQFVTGSARVPVGGFSELVGFNGAKHPFTLSKGSYLKPQSLPMAHACICTLDLPSYEDFETCNTKLTQMLLLGRAHFDEAAGHADD